MLMNNNMTTSLAGAIYMPLHIIALFFLLCAPTMAQENKSAHSESNAITITNVISDTTSNTAVGTNLPFHCASNVTMETSDTSCSISNIMVEKKETELLTSNIGLGLLTTRSMSFVHFLRPHVSTINARPMTKGSYSTGIYIDWGNVWNYNKDIYIIDYEQISIAARFLYAPTDRLTAGLWLPASGRQGGMGDGFIELLHEQFNISNAQREEFSQNNAHIDIQNEDGHHFIRRDGSWGINDIPVFLSYMLTLGNTRWPALIIHTCATIPLGDTEELEGLGKPFYSTGILASKRCGNTKSIVLCGIRLSHTPADSIANIVINNNGIDGIVGLEYEWKPAFSLLAQYTISSPVAKDYKEMARAIHELTVGIKRHINETTIMELSVTENLFKFNNSADAGLHISINRIF